MQKEQHLFCSHSLTQNMLCKWLSSFQMSVLTQLQSRNEWFAFSITTFFYCFSFTTLCMCVLSPSVGFISETLRTVAFQAPLSMKFSRKKTRVGCHFLLQWIFLTQGSKSHLLHWQADSLPLSHLRSTS